MNQIAALQQSMPQEMEAALIQDVSNRFYFTQMKSSAGTLLITKTKAWLLIDFRYYEEACKKAKDCVVVEQTNLHEQVRTLLLQEGINTVSVCTNKMSVQTYSDWYAYLFGIRIDCSDTLADLIETQRMIKTEAEIAWHRKAQHITDKTFDIICGFIKPGMTELEVAEKIGTTLTHLGSDSKHFNFIVASGKNSSLPHGFATRKVIAYGDFVTMDFGGEINGRIADMTRTVAVGGISDEQRKVYNIVLEAQRRAILGVCDGACCKSVDAIARSYIYNAGYEGCFSHGLGHSVGIDVHENPRFNEVCTTKLSDGMIMTVEPGIYLQNHFGVRIEDMVVVRQNGCEILTQSNKDLLIL